MTKAKLSGHMPTKHHHGYWITADGEYGNGDLLYIDTRDLSKNQEARLVKLMEARDFMGVFNLIRSKITTG